MESGSAIWVPQADERWGFVRLDSLAGESTADLCKQLSEGDNDLSIASLIKYGVESAPSWVGTKSSLWEKLFDLAAADIQERVSLYKVVLEGVDGGGGFPMIYIRIS